jgi:flagellar biosynthetic protein FliR
VFSHLLITQVYAFMLIFCRLGSALMLLPGFGESYVPVRLRLGLAIFFSLALLPVAGRLLPPMPSSALWLALLILNEVFIGLFIGAMVNILSSAMHTTGMVLSYQTGLSSVVLFDVSQATQGTAIGNFLGLMALTLMFVLDLHHIMLKGLLDSYALFVPGHLPAPGDVAEMTSRTVAKTFTIALELSAPLIVVGLLLGLAGGVLARLMPIIPIFFMIMAPQILIGFFVIMATLSAVMMYYLRFIEEGMAGIF